jgi:hypothetical protein
MHHILSAANSSVIRSNLIVGVCFLFITRIVPLLRGSRQGVRIQRMEEYIDETLGIIAWAIFIVFAFQYFHI